MPIEVRDDKLKDLIVTLEKTLSPEGIRNALCSVSEIGVAEATNLVPVKSGRLRDSIYADVISNDTLELGAAAPYASAVEYGTSRQRAKPFMEPASRKAAAVLSQLLKDLVSSTVRSKRGVGRPTTTGAGTYTPTGNSVGRPKTKQEALNQFKGHKESSKKTARRYISKRRSPSTGKWIYEYGDQPRLGTARVRKTDRRIKRTGSANRGQ